VVVAGGSLEDGGGPAGVPSLSHIYVYDLSQTSHTSKQLL